MHINLTQPVTRREMLARAGMGFGTWGLMEVLRQADPASGLVRAAEGVNPLAPKPAPQPSKAKQVVHLFMNGGPSQVDTFDPKPLLMKHHGKPLPATNLRTERKTSGALGSPFKFKKYGPNGTEISELFERTAECVDDLCIIRSMHADVPNHEPSLWLMNCGEGRQPRPSFGSWVTYGLGSENQNLPGFIAMCPGGLPVTGAQNWRSAFLPGAFQGTYIDSKHTEIDKLIANIRNPEWKQPDQRRQLDLLKKLNEKHLEERQKEAALETRLQTFELAYRMQMEAADAFDISKETKAVQEMYGSGTHGRQLLITRRLIERGVRFIQLYSGNFQPWDNHNNVVEDHKKLAKEWDQPIAAFLKDLKQRGLLASTLVMWGGEFGRTPTAEMPQLTGRDHNHYGFSMWLAGGGTRGGHVHGATDEFGFSAVEKKVHVHDLHATLLKLLGFDHEKLTYRYAGRDFRLTDVHGNVVPELMA